MTFTRNQVFLWTCGMIVVALGLSIYLTTYVWRRVDKPKSAADTLVVLNKEDYTYFYAAAKAMTEGRDIYKEEAPGQGRAGYIYPPLIAFLYQPLAHLDMNTGARISLLVNVAALAAGLGIASRELLKRLGSRSDWQAVLTIGVLAAVLGIDKIRGELQMLQTNAIVMLAMVAGLWLLDKRPVWAGAALGFAINVKYQALALLLYLLFRRRWKGAAATVIWAAAWGLVPAITVGLRQDLNYLGQGFAGVLRLVGVTTGGDAANIEPIGSGLSVSITSAAARFLTKHHIAMSPLIVAGIVALAWLGAMAWLYAARKVPAIVWPNAPAQRNAPFFGLVAMEWVAVIAAVLAFSPQTNTRHMVLTTLLFVLGLVLVIECKGREKWIAGLGMVVLWMGLNLPPGRRTEGGQTDAVAIWHGMGGPSWSLLVATLMLAWTGVAVARVKAPVVARLASSAPVNEHEVG